MRHASYSSANTPIVKIYLCSCDMFPFIVIIDTKINNFSLWRGKKEGKYMSQ